MAKLLVIGASGGIGRQVVQQALARGHEVRAMARSASKLDIDDPRLEKRDGDALKPDDVASALAGVDVVVQTLGVPLRPGTIVKQVDLFSKATKILLAAMKDAGVRRLLCVTGFGAGDSGERVGRLQRIPFRFVFGRIYDDKGIQESLIKASGLDWVIARPGVLTDGAHTGHYRVLVEPEQWRNGLISRADVADFLVAQIDGDRYLGCAPVVID